MWVNKQIAGQILDCCDRTLIRYRDKGKLLEGIHWGRNPSGKVLYHQELLENLVACGGIHSTEHQNFIQRVVGDRPENRKKKG